MRRRKIQKHFQSNFSSFQTFMIEKWMLVLILVHLIITFILVRWFSRWTQISAPIYYQIKTSYQLPQPKVAHQYQGTPHSTTYHTTVIHIPQHITPWYSTFNNIPKDCTQHSTSYQTMALHNTPNHSTQQHPTPYHRPNKLLGHSQKT